MNECSFTGIMVELKQDPAAVERRDQILAAAAECFAKRGFHQTTMQDISGTAGISVGLIYRYFANKDTVIEEMAREHKRHIGEVMERAREAESIDEALRIFFGLGDSEDAACPSSAYVVELFAEAGRNPDVAKRVADVGDSIRSALHELVAKSSDELLANSGLSIDETVEILMTMKLGLHMSETLYGQSREPESHSHGEFLYRLWDVFTKNNKGRQIS